MHGSLSRFFVFAAVSSPLWFLASCAGARKPPVGVAAAPQPASQERGQAAVLFPPEGTDHLAVELTVEIDVLGIGKDRFTLDGSMAVHRGGPAGEGGRAVHGHVVAASFHGESKLLGEVVVFESPLASSPCEYRYLTPGEYADRFDLNCWLWLPEHDLLLASGSPVRVEGTTAAIPPVGHKAVTATRDVPLQDLRRRDGKAVGFFNRASAEIRGVMAREDLNREAGVLANGLAASP
jgi:hypothetical protein